MAKGASGKYFQDGRVRTGNDYALLLGEVLRSEAHRACPDYACRVLVALAAGFRKVNNGDLSLTFGVAKEYGINSEWKLRAGLAVLERVGLIERTRVGRIERGKGICSLFALGWRQIDPSEKHDVPSVVAVRAPMRWARWTAPEDWSAQLDRIRHAAQGKREKFEESVFANSRGPGATEKAHYTPEEQAATHLRSGAGPYRPTPEEQEQRSTATHLGGPSKKSGSPPSSRMRPGASSVGQDALRAKVVKLIRLQPHLTDRDISETFKQPTLDAVAVRSIREGMNS